MPQVVLAPAAVADLERLIRVLELPAEARTRVSARLGQLARFPESGEVLGGRWEGFRFVLGPWRWMLIVYAFDEEADQVSVLTIQDSRSARSATSES